MTRQSMPPDAPQTPALPAATASVPASFTVLVVDDTPMNTAIVDKALSKEGYQVLTAANGPQARALAARQRPDLIVLDVMMPGEDGFAVMRWLKDDVRTAAIPVIFLTTRDDIATKLAGFALGAVDYIVKPFHPLEMCARVRLHLQLSHATHALLAHQAHTLAQLRAAQSALLVAPEELPAARFGVSYASLQEAGGDFYDVLQIAPDIYGYFVADVAGHDLRTSFLTAAVKALLKQNCSAIYSPSETMRMLNTVLREIVPCGKFLTACYARLNRKTRLISLVNAGQPPAVYVPRHGAARLLELPGDVLGIFPSVCHEQFDLKVSAGDRLFLYSDGLLERPAQRQGWPGRIEQLLDYCDRLRDTAITAAAPQLAAWMGAQAGQPEDDIVTLALEV
ncbi:MAG: PP2C family protein-serine/threonine phosphatase [Candidatus Tectimicrobiota bacterium]